MGASRPLTPVPGVLPGLRVTGYATATAVPIGLSKDRKTLYGTPSPSVSSSTTFYQSVDDGTTWTSVHTFAESVYGALETDDGEILVATVNTAATPGYIYKSSGWATSHTTATWTKKLTTTGGFIKPVWGLHNSTFGNDAIVAGSSKYGFVNEYGSQTAGSADSTKAVHAYFTSDYGATWTQVLDLQARYGATIQPLHLHASAYDPYWDRLWASYGDLQADGTTNSQVLYSDDHGTTWSVLPLPAEFSALDGLQSTGIYVGEDAIILSSDNKPGIVVIPRDGWRTPGPIQPLNVLHGGSASGLIGQAVYRNRSHPNAPILASFQNVSSKINPSIQCSLDGGRSFTEIWRDASLSGSSAVYGVFGPTYNGKIAAWVSNTANSTNYLLRGELIIPDPDLYDGIVNITGDATTTVFTVAHGLSAKPNQLVTWPTSAAAAAATYAATADATNITFTFTAAPASAAVIDLAYRASV